MCACVRACVRACVCVCGWLDGGEFVFLSPKMEFSKKRWKMCNYFQSMVSYVHGSSDTEATDVLLALWRRCVG